MTTAFLARRGDDGGVDSVEDPAARSKRRSFTAAYKARILAEHDALPKGSAERGVDPTRRPVFLPYRGMA